MKNKITLITPPDFFENNEFSLLLVGLNDVNQQSMTTYLSNLEFDKNINIYFHMDENEPTWILYSLGKSSFCFMDLDNTKSAAATLSAYILSKPNTYYSTTNEYLATQVKVINSNRVPDFDFFLQEILSNVLNKK